MYLLCILHFTDVRFSWTLKISPRFDNYSINLICAAEIFQLMTRIFDEIVIYVLEISAAFNGYTTSFHP